MSRGPGRVQRAIEELFRNNPTATFSTEELAAHVYPGINRVEKAHRVAILRAVEPVAIKLWWQMSWSDRPGHQMICYNLCDVMSYGMGRLRVDFITGGYPHEDLQRFLTDPSAYRNEVDKIVPGGTWWTHVQINQAMREGREEEAEAMRCAWNAEVDRRLKAATDALRAGRRAA